MTRLICLLAAALLVIPMGVAADPWSDHNRTGEWAYAQGDNERAEKEFRAALELASKLPPGSLRLETSLGNLARFFENRSRLDEAQPLFQLLLAAQEERLGEDHPELLDTIAAVARVSLATGDVPTAQGNLERYVSLADATGGGDPQDLVRVLILLARTAVITEEYDKALPLQRRAVEVMTTDDRMNDLEIAAAMDSLARLEIAHGDPARAEDLVVEAASRRQAAGEPGQLAASLTTAAGAAAAAHHAELARSLARRALADPDITTDLAIEVRLVLAEAAWLHFPMTSAALTDLVGSAAPGPATDAAVADLTDAVAFFRQMPADGRFAAVEQRLVRALVMAGDTTRAVTAQRSGVEHAGDPISARAQLVDLLLLADDRTAAAGENAQLIELLEANGASHALVSALERQEALLKELKRRKEARAAKKRLKKVRRELGL